MRGVVGHSAITTSIERLLTGTSLTQTTIAARCGVSISAVCDVARAIGISPWARNPERKVHEQTARNQEIIRLVGIGRTYKEIGKRYGISRQRAHQIVQLYREKSA